MRAAERGRRADSAGAAVLGVAAGSDGELEDVDVDDKARAPRLAEHKERTSTPTADDCDVGAGPTAATVVTLRRGPDDRSAGQALSNAARAAASLVPEPRVVAGAARRAETWFQNLLLSFRSTTFAAMRGRLVAPRRCSPGSSRGRTARTRRSARARRREFCRAPWRRTRWLARFPVLRGCFVAGAALLRPLFRRASRPQARQAHPHRAALAERHGARRAARLPDVAVIATASCPGRRRRGPNVIRTRCGTWAGSRRRTASER